MLYVLVVPAQIVVVPEMDPGWLGVLLTDMVVVLDVAVLVVKQVAFDVNTTAIVFPFVNPALLKVLLFVPIGAPFNNHWYAGVAPPLVGVAEKVTLVPEQMVVPGFALTVTLGVTFGETVIVTEFDVAGLPATQGKLELITQVTTSLLFKVDEVNVVLLVPTLLPFTFH